MITAIDSTVNALKKSFTVNTNKDEINGNEFSAYLLLFGM